MPDPPAVLLACVLAAGAAGCLATLVGFGGNLVLVPVLSLVIGVKDAVVLGLITGIANPLGVTVMHRAEVSGRALLRMAAWSAPFAAAGLLVQRTAPDRLLLGIVAAVALGAGLRVLTEGPDPRPSPRPWRRGLRLSLLPVGGFVQGAAATSGPLFVAWLAAEERDKGRFRATISALWTVMNPPLAAAAVLATADPGVHLLRAAWCVPAVVVAYVIGQRGHDRLDQRIFRRTVAVLLLLAGLSAAAKTLTG